MQTPLRVIRGTSAALYPFTQVYTAFTSISDSQAAVPARSVKWPPLVRFEFSYNPLTQAQKNQLKSDFVSAKGQATGGNGSASLSVTTDITYTDLGFDVDEFSAIEQLPTQYGVKWSLTQALPQSFSPGASGGAYPLLTSGAIGQLAYSQKKRFQTIVSKMESGPKYTFAEFAGGLTGYPTDGLMAWEFDEPALTDADVATKVAHWLANWGNAFPFTFTDEDGVVYSNVYYAAPTLTIERQQWNVSRIKTALVQTN
jgi:hypothetical protein